MDAQSWARIVEATPGLVVAPSVLAAAIWYFKRSFAFRMSRLASVMLASGGALVVLVVPILLWAEAGLADVGILILNAAYFGMVSGIFALILTCGCTLGRVSVWLTGYLCVNRR